MGKHELIEDSLFSVDILEGERVLICWICSITLLNDDGRHRGDRAVEVLVRLRDGARQEIASEKA